MHIHTHAIRAAGIAMALWGLAFPPLAHAAAASGTDKPASAEQRRERKEYVETRHSIYLLGQAYYGDGNHVGKAARLWRKAAGMCDVDAQSSLGYLYYIGMGVSQSYKQALKWYLRAARAGSSDAQYSLATMYYRGQGIAKDRARAIAWFRVALANGNGDAAEELRFTEKHASPDELLEAHRLAKRILDTPPHDTCRIPQSPDHFLAKTIQ